MISVKENIMKTAAELFLENSIHGTSTKLIVTTAGVSNGALFNHFANKDELVYAIYKSYKDELRLALKKALNSDDGTRKFLHDYWNATIQWSLDNPKKKKFILTFALQPNVINCMRAYDENQYDFLISKLKKSIEEREILLEDVNHFTFIFMGVTDGIINYLNFNTAADQDKVINDGFIQFWRSIVNY